MIQPTGSGFLSAFTPCPIKPKADKSSATKTGHLDVLPTVIYAGQLVLTFNGTRIEGTVRQCRTPALIARASAWMAASSNRNSSSLIEL